MYTVQPRGLPDGGLSVAQMESVQRCLSELEALVLRLTALEDMVAARQAAPLPLKSRPVRLAERRADDDCCRRRCLRAPAGQRRVTEGGGWQAEWGRVTGPRFIEQPDF